MSSQGEGAGSVYHGQCSGPAAVDSAMNLLLWAALGYQVILLLSYLGVRGQGNTGWVWRTGEQGLCANGVWIVGWQALAGIGGTTRDPSQSQELVQAPRHGKRERNHDEHIWQDGLGAESRWVSCRSR